jgi:8-oxo-dGTP pyrophosphatase MutT (NUDIX family)
LLSFDPSRAASVPRHAATVVAMKENAGSGLQVFCVLRHPRSGFLGGAVVFPGGKVEGDDALLGGPELASAPDARVAEMVEDDLTPRALAAAACRETFEEGAILPIDPPLDEASFQAFQAEASGQIGGHPQTPGALAGALARNGLRLALDQLVPCGRWITPEAESRRFDARFFLLELPPGQVGRHDDHETTMSFWARPAIVLDRFVRGEIFLAPPTTRTLELLATVDSVPAARALAAQQSLRPICPLFVPDNRVPFLALPGDPAHALRERRVAGPTRFVLRDGRLLSEESGHGAGEAGGGPS